MKDYKINRYSRALLYKIKRLFLSISPMRIFIVMNIFESLLILEIKILLKEFY
jgi:hypothetical protein